MIKGYPLKFTCCTVFININSVTSPLWALFQFSTSVSQIESFSSLVSEGSLYGSGVGAGVPIFISPSLNPPPFLLIGRRALFFRVLGREALSSVNRKTDRRVWYGSFLIVGVLRRGWSIATLLVRSKTWREHARVAVDRTGENRSAGARKKQTTS